MKQAPIRWPLAAAFFAMLLMALAGAWGCFLPTEASVGRGDDSPTPTPTPTNRPPRIEAFTANPQVLVVGSAISDEDTVRLSCRAVDPDGDAIRYVFRASSGYVTTLGGTEAIYLPERHGEHVLSCDACDAARCDHAEVLVEVRR